MYSARQQLSDDLKVGHLASLITCAAELRSLRKQDSFSHRNPAVFNSRPSSRS